MKLSLITATLLTTPVAAMLLATGCSSSPLATEESNMSSCEGAYVDQRGYCRNSNGRFAAKICCSAPSEHCLFGEQWYSLAQSPNVEIVDRYKLTSVEQLTELQKQQALAAMDASYKAGVTLDELFSRVDLGTIDYMRLDDPYLGRQFEVFDFLVNDNPAGAIFFAGTTDIAAANDDGEFNPCQAFEPQDRWNQLEFEATTLPDELSSLPGLFAMRVNGLEPGNWLPFSAIEQMVDRTRELHGDGCDGLPSGDEANASLIYGGAWDLMCALKWSEGYASTLNEQQQAVLNKYFEQQGEDNYDLYEADLLNSACGQNLMGTFFLVHGRHNHELLYFRLVQ